MSVDLVGLGIDAAIRAASHLRLALLDRAKLDAFRVAAQRPRPRFRRALALDRFLKQEATRYEKVDEEDGMLGLSAYLEQVRHVALARPDGPHAGLERPGWVFWILDGDDRDRLAPALDPGTLDADALRAFYDEHCRAPGEEEWPYSGEAMAEAAGTLREWLAAMSGSAVLVVAVQDPAADDGGPFDDLRATPPGRHAAGVCAVSGALAVAVLFTPMPEGIAFGIGVVFAVVAAVFGWTDWRAAMRSGVRSPLGRRVLRILGLACASVLLVPVLIGIAIGVIKSGSG